MKVKAKNTGLKIGGQPAEKISQAELKKKVDFSNKVKSLNVSDIKIELFDGNYFAVDKLKTLNAQNCNINKIVNGGQFFCKTMTKINLS